jgi:hypothetical protein
MNLCGGISSISEQDLLFQLPLEGFSLSPRKQKTSSTASRPANSVNAGSATPSPRTSSALSRRRDQSLINKSTTETQTGTSGTLLNPVSKDDLEKLRSRQQQQSYPSRGLKSSSILMKKLESGFNVVRRLVTSGVMLIIGLGLLTSAHFFVFFWM